MDNTLREHLRRIRHANVWARNIVQAMDDVVIHPEDGETVPRAMKVNAFFLEHGDRPVPTMAPAEIAAALRLGDHPRDHQ